MRVNLILRAALLLLITYLGFGICYAQNRDKQYTDSLEQILIKANVKDIDKVNSYLELTKIFIHKNIDSSIFYVEKGKLLAEKSSNIKEVVECLIQLARIKEVQNEIYGSLEYLNEAEKYYEGIDKDYNYMTICNYKGMYYEMLSNYDKSIEKYLIGLKVARDLSNRGYESVFLGNLSIVYSKANQFEKSLTSSLGTHAINNEIGSRNQYFQATIYVGNSYFNLKKYEFAKEYLNKAKEYFEKSNDHILLSDIYLTLANISMNTGNQEEALELFILAQYHAMEMKDYNGEQNYKLAIANNSLGTIYLYFKDFPKAIKLFRASEKIGKILNSNQALKGSYKGLYESYLGIKKLDSVAHYLNLFIPVNDSVVSEQYNEKINTLNYDFQLEKEKENFEKDMRILMLEKNRKELIYTTLIGILFILVLIGFIIRYVQKSKLQKSELTRENLQLEKENMLNLLYKKNSELTANILNLIERNEFVAKLSERLQDFVMQKDSLKSDKIEDIIRSINQDSSTNLWQEFEHVFMEIHKDFYQKLSAQYPELSPNDRKLCAFILLNMSTKDISSITYQSLHSIKIARYRLRKKLELSKNESLTSFLNNL